MAEVISFYTNKGGVGKTSLVTNLAAALTKKHPKKKVLIVDTDAQGNASIAFGKKPKDFEKTIYDVLLGEASINEVIVNLGKNIDIVPANKSMKTIDFDILLHIEKYKRPLDLLKGPIQEVRERYDYIFIDSAPYIGLVGSNVLNVTDKVIVPFTPETFAVQGLINIVDEIEDFKEKANSKLELLGIVCMMAELRTTLHSETLADARKYCDRKGYKLYDTVIAKSIRFASSTAYEGKPAVWTDSSNPIVSAYFELLQEVIGNDTKKR